MSLPPDSIGEDTFLPHDAMLVRYMLSSCVCLFVRPSVCPSQADTVPKLLNIGSRK